MYYHFLGGITTETNFDLILSSPDDKCFQIVIFISGLGSVSVSSLLTNRITEHYPDSQVISQQELRIRICCTLSINIVNACFDHGYSTRQFCKLRYKMLVRPINLSL